jgi:hypothetical protein
MSDRYPRLLDETRVEVCLTSGSTQVLTMAECVEKIQHLNKAIHFLEAGQPLSDQEIKHGFPCGHCGAKSFNDASEKCHGLPECPGCDMSREVFDEVTWEAEPSRLIPGIPAEVEPDRLYFSMSKPLSGYSLGVVIRGEDCNWKSRGIVAHFPLPIMMNKPEALRFIRTGEIDLPTQGETTA